MSTTPQACHPVCTAQQLAHCSTAASNIAQQLAHCSSMWSPQAEQVTSYKAMSTYRGPDEKPRIFFGTFGLVTHPDKQPQGSPPRQRCFLQVCDRVCDRQRLRCASVVPTRVRARTQRACSWQCPRAAPTPSAKALCPSRAWCGVTPPLGHSSPSSQ